MKYLLVLLSFSLFGCASFNAAVDGAQGVVNSTLTAAGNGVAGLTSAVGEDVSGAVTYTTETAAQGIRKVTNSEK